MTTRTRSLTPEDRAARQLRFAALSDQVDALERTISIEALAAFGAQFDHPYSPRNLLFILAQCPTATDVAGFARWRERGRCVRKGEKGIAIFAPLPSREETDGSADGEDAAPHRFRPTYVFDVGQTEPLPDGAE
jgi:hypothetical protein